MIRKILQKFNELRFPELKLEMPTSEMVITKYFGNGEIILVQVLSFETNIAYFISYDANTFEIKSFGEHSAKVLNCSYETNIEDATENNINQVKSIIENFIDNYNPDEQIKSCKKLIDLNYKNIEKIESKINRINREIEFYKW